MMRAGMILGLLGALSTMEDPPKPAPVLVELFTSEGCSSCPSADALLEELDRTQPAPGAHAVVLSEHVDYWNQLGWKDPYSSAAFSSRQSEYAAKFHLFSPYTPQMVIDGNVEVLGSDGAAVRKAVTRAAGARRLTIRILETRRDGADVAVRLHADPISADARLGHTDVWVALAAERETSHVLRGENSGRTLAHVAVVIQLRKIGKIDKSQGYAAEVRLPTNGAAGALRVVAFLQLPGLGSVVGVDATPVLR